MTKIVFITDGFPPEHQGGAGVMAQQLANYSWSDTECPVLAGQKKYKLNRFAARQNTEVTVISTTLKSKDTISENHDWGKLIRIPANEHPHRTRFFLTTIMNRQAKEALRMIKEIKPDIIHCHNIHQFFSFALLSKIRRCFPDIKLFLTAHDVMSINYGKIYDVDKVKGKDNPHALSLFEVLDSSRLSYIPFRLTLIKKHLKTVTNIIAVSDSLKSYLSANGVRKIKVIHNGILPPSDVSIPAELKRLLGEGGKWVVFSGRVTRSKGIFRLLEAFSDVVKSVPDVKLLVIGDGSKKFDSYVSKYGLEDKVFVSGWVPHNVAQNLLSYGSLCVVPTLTIDCFPTVMLEAAAMRCPLIVTCFGGAKEMIRDSRDGYVVNPYEDGVLEDRMLRLLEDADLAKRFTESAFKRFSSEFSFDSFIRKHKELYSSA